MTQIISAFPCLGKTTLCNLNRDTIFDREFNESRSVRGMLPEEKAVFFQQCADMVELQKNTNFYDYIFITDNPELVSLLDQDSIIHVYPDVFDDKVMEYYKKQVIERSGTEWYERVITQKLIHLKEHINQLLQNGYDVRLTNLEDRYIEDVYEFHPQIQLPKDNTIEQSINQGVRKLDMCTLQISPKGGWFNPVRSFYTQEQAIIILQDKYLVNVIEELPMEKSSLVNEKERFLLELEKKEENLDIYKADEKKE